LLKQSISNVQLLKHTTDYQTALSFLRHTIGFSTDLLGQKPKRYNSSEIQLMLEKLQVLGSVLYVAAHPDDENTAIITYFANERKVHTAYFSFTRGDGGQNLIVRRLVKNLG
jgi:hypothetical protein